MSGRMMVLFALVLPLNAVSSSSADDDIGVFEQSNDIGQVGHSGEALYDAALGTYAVSGSGANMWFAEDGLHYVWKKMSGDVSLAADVELIGEGGDPHRKACLLIRQSLDHDSAYADAALHGDGLTSLQYREAQGAPTREIQANSTSPRRLRIEKIGEYVSMSIAADGEPLKPAGGTFRLKLTDPFYVGLAVCAHDNTRLEKAVFTNVEIVAEAAGDGEPVLESTLETVAISSGDRRVAYHTRDHIEAPNWSRDGESLLFNQGGGIYRIPVAGGTPTQLNTGRAVRNNNDHGLSPDGNLLAISDQTDGPSRIFVVATEGGEPRRVTPLAPSYWHGWSPDGKTLAYCAERDGNYDIYAIPVDGGEERRLTTAEGLDDGPDYAPDGTIYFNSVRSGRMQIWKMNADGSEQSQVTKDEYNDWFPHPSPDGNWLVFLSYEKDVTGHPENKDVMLRLMPLAGGEVRVLAKLFGGQGTINVPSWSPDSKSVAFVSYRLVRPRE
jgi:TolB protein